MSGPNDDPMMFQAGAGMGLVVTEIPERVPAVYPVLAFLVEGIEQLVQELAARGVAFEGPDASSSFQGRTGAVAGPITDYGPVESAWFKDTEGNILALNEIVRSVGRCHARSLEPVAEPPADAGAIVVRDGVGVLVAQRVDARADEGEHRHEQRGAARRAVEHEQPKDREDRAERESHSRVPTLRWHGATLHPPGQRLRRCSRPGHGMKESP
jgi:hypothetical protein